MSVRTFVLCGLLVLAASIAWAQAEPNDDPTAGLTDWLSIPDFTVEVTLGVGATPNGGILGETGAFAKRVGTVYCRVDGIGLTEKEKLAVVWFREDEQRARQTVELTKNKPHALTSLNIPAVQAGSWRVEVVDANDEVLAVVPFVVGRSSVSDVPAPKSVDQKKD
ncbi:MAG: DUF2914 domain-containing protein [Candidatus Lernaella stagnicola]|nr:DUF2914 domain-containing protein [Candidatus Lernaella stagnicola]